MNKRGARTSMNCENPQPRAKSQILDEVVPPSREQVASYLESYWQAHTAWGHEVTSYFALIALATATMREIEERDQRAAAENAESIDALYDPEATVAVPLWAAQAVMCAVRRMEGGAFDEDRPEIKKRLTLAEAFGLAAEARGQAGLLARQEAAARCWKAAVMVADLRRSGVSKTDAVRAAAQKIGADERSVFRWLGERYDPAMRTWEEIAEVTLAASMSDD